MIKQFFLPSIIGTRRIFAQTILGCRLEENRISIAIVHAMRSKSSINFLAEEPLESGLENTYQERATNALKRILTRVPSFDIVHIAIPASSIVFKELRLPFLDSDKIKMIIEYEVEPLLPFSVDEAIIDFIITKQEQGSSQVLVAAIRTEDLENHLIPYTNAGLTPDTITIDLFALYGLYQQIPEYRELPHASALIDIEPHVTRIAFLYHGELRLTRNISQGFLSLATAISQEISKNEQDVIALLLENGLKKTGDALYDQVVEKHIMTLLSDIQFTLNSFSLKLSFYEGINKILFVGSYATIPEFVSFSSALLQTPCELFACEKIFAHSSIKNNIKTQTALWGRQAIALGTALTHPTHIAFNLRRKNFALTDTELAYKQLLMSCLLIIITISGLAGYGYFQISTMTKTAEQLETKEIKRLQALLPSDIKLPKKIGLKRLITEAESIIAARKEAWGSQNKEDFTPIELLQELTRLLDRKKFDVRIDLLSMGPDEQGKQKITLDGVLHSKTGSEPWAHFGLFEKLWDESKTLALVERIDPSQTEDGMGVRFTAQLKRKES